MTIRKRIGIVYLFFMLGAFTGAPAAAQDGQIELIRSEWPLFRQAGGEWVVLGEALVADPAGGAGLSRVSLEVLGPDGTVVATRRYVPADFDEMVLGDPGLSGPGAVLFVWTTLTGPAPARARVKVELSDARVFEGEASLSPFEPGFQARPPVRGGPWVANNSFGAAHHWLGSLLPNETATQFWVGERFAVDMVLLDDFPLIDFLANPHPDKGMPPALEDFYSWGQPVRAMAPGRVAAVETHHADQQLGESDGNSPSGNVVVIEHAPGIYGWYAHLMQGSVAVEPGDALTTGAVLGRVGNSGNTTNPHLHVHLSDRPEEYRAQGLPLTFTAGRMLVLNDQRDDIADVQPLENSALPDVALFIAPGAIAEAGVVHAASWRTGPLAPGQIFSINGEGLGPPSGAVGQFDSNGSLERQVSGVAVLVNGMPAPVYFASGGQVNAQAPYSLQQASQARVRVSYAGELSNEVVTSVAATAPGLFEYPGEQGRVLAVHADGSLNAPGHPARAGDIVVLYATGEGVTTPPAGDGVRAAEPYPQPAAEVTLLIGGQPADLLYAGSAPDFVGLMQINARVPGGVSGEVPVTLAAGTQVSKTVILSVE